MRYRVFCRWLLYMLSLWHTLTHTNAQMHVCIARYNFRYTCSSLAGGRVFSVSRDERRVSSTEWCFKLRSNREYGEYIRCATLFLVRRKYIHRVVGILSRIHALRIAKMNQTGARYCFRRWLDDFWRSYIESNIVNTLLIARPLHNEGECEAHIC